MSTIRKIYGQEGQSLARVGSKRRAQAIREMARIVRMYQDGSTQRFRAESLVQALKEVHNDSRFTSAQKDASFVRLLNRKR